MIAKTVEDLNQKTAARVRYWRQALGFTQKELADALGCSFQQVQKYETGKNRISVGTLYVIADTMGVAITTLLPESGIPTQPSSTGTGSCNTEL